MPGMPHGFQNTRLITQAHTCPRSRRRHWLIASRPPGAMLVGAPPRMEIDFVEIRTRLKIPIDQLFAQMQPSRKPLTSGHERGRCAIPRRRHGGFRRDKTFNLAVANDRVWVEICRSLLPDWTAVFLLEPPYTHRSGTGAVAALLQIKDRGGTFERLPIKRGRKVSRKSEGCAP